MFFLAMCPASFQATASGYVQQNFAWQGLMHGADWLPTLVEGAAEQRRDWEALGHYWFDKAIMPESAHVEFAYFAGMKDRKGCIGTCKLQR